MNLSHFGLSISYELSQKRKEKIETEINKIIEEYENRIYTDIDTYLDNHNLEMSMGVIFKKLKKRRKKNES